MPHHETIHLLPGCVSRLCQQEPNKRDMPKKYCVHTDFMGPVLVLIIFGVWCYMHAEEPCIHFPVEMIHFSVLVCDCCI